MARADDANDMRVDGVNRQGNAIDWADRLDAEQDNQ
jgi:hypothetical protein